MRADEPRITALQSRIHSDLVARVDRHDAAGQVLVVAAGEVGRFHHPLPRVLRRMLASAPSDRASGLKSLPQEQPSAAIGLQPIVRSYDSRFPIPDSRFPAFCGRCCAGTVGPRVGTEVPPTKTAQGPRSVSTDRLLLRFPNPDSRIPAFCGRCCAGTVGPRVGTEVPPTRTAQRRDRPATDRPLLRFPNPDSRIPAFCGRCCAGAAGPRVGTEVPSTRTTQLRDQSATDRPLLRFPNPDSQFPASQIL
ncbi:hypothetical protein NB705_000836 [Xanthomonas sacchari]|nr:hypothetical protein [Xanthomonas sacchari]